MSTQWRSAILVCWHDIRIQRVVKSLVEFTKAVVNVPCVEFKVASLGGGSGSFIVGYGCGVSGCIRCQMSDEGGAWLC